MTEASEKTSQQWQELGGRARACSHNGAGPWHKLSSGLLSQEARGHLHRPQAGPASCKWVEPASNRCDYRLSPPLDMLLKAQVRRFIFIDDASFLERICNPKSIISLIWSRSSQPPSRRRHWECCACRLPAAAAGLLLHPGIIRRGAVGVFSSSGLSCLSALHLAVTLHMMI